MCYAPCYAFVRTAMRTERGEAVGLVSEVAAAAVAASPSGRDVDGDIEVGGDLAEAVPDVAFVAKVLNPCVGRTGRRPSRTSDLIG
jgi:hypothetical protein